ncbi:MAG TPA: transcription termination/antitermination NusG family protein [Phycisphaerae bacterium]|nr:transcription termination/antitermination NusG family protein [Phycisphaerae bacterium]HOJ74583.1 transcription termination/antitermination NusG family protein [Phycisphaerae bacterium]HOM50482.1 transcription termination/antitermination NusG family protein [Phycisphaerae bacterium]HON68147.1 transcription termination/antitermination NusG family protein [Phycisphaerae bacterium]HOQ87587.1 transcription termination/antitermination NusG family protein [Phycisphaerae bacterium]
MATASLPAEAPDGAEAADSPVLSADGEWWVVHTKARNEKALAADLTKLGVHHFLPLVHTIRKHGGRKVSVDLPLFPSYLFVCGGETERYVTLTTHRVARVIKVVDQERFRGELQQIYRVIQSGRPVDLYPRLRRGQRCRIIRGSLSGVEGVVVRRRDLCRVYLGVEVLGQSAELEIDPAWVEVLD